MKKMVLKKKYWLNQPTNHRMDINITLLTWVIGKNCSIVVDSFSKWITQYWLIRVTCDFIEQRSPHGSCDRKTISMANVNFFVKTPCENVPHWPYFIDYRHRKNIRWNRRNKTDLRALRFSSTLYWSFLNEFQFSNSLLINFLRCREEKNEAEKKSLT